MIRTIPSDNGNKWRCEINGVKYTFPAGATMDVPAEVAELIDAYNATPKDEKPPKAGEEIVAALTGDGLVEAEAPTEGSDKLITSGATAEALQFGAENVKSGNGAFATGNKNIASGDQSVAMGKENIASGQDSIALGNNCVSSGQNAFATGYRAVAGPGISAWCFGNASSNSPYPKATNNLSCQVGLGYCHGAYGVGIGNTIVTADSGIAIGTVETRVSGRHSQAIGLGVVASRRFQVVLGTFNHIDKGGEDAANCSYYVDGNNSNTFTLPEDVQITSITSVKKNGTEDIEYTFNDNILTTATAISRDEFVKITYTGKGNQSYSTLQFIVGVGTGTSDRCNGLALERTTNNLKVKGNVYVECNDDSTGGTQLAPIPPCPTSADGTFALKCTVANGVATYSWVAE